MTSILLDDFSKLFKPLQKTFKAKIRIFSVFDHGVICATSDDEVYLIGEQFSKQLGYEDPDHDYSLVTELSGKHIEEFFTSGNEWVIFRNTYNKVFSLGLNDHGQLGRGQVSSNRESLKAEEIKFFSDKNIIDISCGRNHCLALSSDCLVFGWGDNCEGQVGCGNNCAIIETPTQIVINERVKHIHCDSLASFVITVTDQVYFWGNIQLKNSIFATNVPFLLRLGNVSKVYQDHFGQNIITLQKNGKVYTFDGKNQIPVQSIESIEFTDMAQVSFNKLIALLPNEMGRSVHELSKSGVIAMNFFNINDYFVHKHNVTNGTILITNDETIKSKHIQISDQNILNIVYKNIFDMQFNQMFLEDKQIGEGAFGHVLQVRDKKSNEIFAIKRLEPKSEQDSFKNDIQSVMNEIRIMSKLSDDYTVNYKKAWIEGKVIDRNLVNFVYIQMEFCPKKLQNIIDLLATESLEEYEIFKYFIRSEILFEIIECIKYLHTLDEPIFHRDLKPANILISFGQNGRFVKLCDFGLAKFFRGSISNTRAIGTIEYTAPEVLNGTYYGLKSDIYSLSVIITKIFGIDKKIYKKMHKDKQGCLEKYSAFHSNDTLKEKLSKLFDEIIKMSKKEYKERPDSQLLLTNANKWLIPKELVITDKNFNELTNVLDKPDMEILKLILKTKSNQIDNLKGKNSQPEFKNFHDNRLHEKLKSKVKYYHQIGESDSYEYSAFLVLNDDKVYSLGYNETGILGLGHEILINEHILVQELCDQNIEEFFEGKNCLFARSNKNQIFSWGYNRYGQLARGYSSVECLKPRKIDFFEYKNIIDITCGSNHCLAFSEEGVLYGWGRNDWGQTGSRIENSEEHTPIRIQLSDYFDYKISFVNCYDFSSSAVTVDGRAFLWGKVNGRKISSSNPIPIETNVSKFYFHSNLNFSILTTDGIFRFKKLLITNMIENIELAEIKDVVDIYGTSVILKHDFVYEVNNENNIQEKSNFTNFFEFFLYEKKKIVQTIHITEDEYIMQRKIHFDANSFDKPLKKLLFHIYDQKVQNNLLVRKKIEVGCLLNTKIRNLKNIYDNLEASFSQVNSRSIINFNANNFQENLYEKIRKYVIDGKLEKCFKIFKPIGRGGSGTVLQVKEKETSKLFAIKRIEIKGDFLPILKEIRIMSKLKNDKYVVKYHDSWAERRDTDTYVYIKMELCSQNLKDLIKIINNLNDAMFKTLKYFIRSEIFVKIIDCLNYLHSLKIIHRDLKIQNILITTKDNHLKLCDFGLSKIIEEFNTPYVGTNQYMAPEVYNTYDPRTKKSEYTLKADIFSLGIIAINLFDLKDNLVSLRNLTALNNYFEYYSDENLKQKFTSVFYQISLMLSEKPEKRLSCDDLLGKTREWTIDPKISENNQIFMGYLQLLNEREENTQELNILKSLLEYKQ